MIHSNQVCAPEIHKAACVIAKRFADMMSAILRDEARREAERKEYLIACEVIEGMSKEGKR